MEQLDSFGKWRSFYSIYIKILKSIIFLFLGLSTLGIVVMMIVTCVDIICRILRISFTGAYDIVMIAGAITITCALPYTTAVKGHVAIEYFFHKLSKKGRIVVDTIARLFGMCFFIMLTIQSLKYGKSLFLAGEVTLTLQIPVFWIPYVISLSCCLVALVIFYNLLHPGKVMIKL